MDVGNMVQADCILLELIHVFENDVILEEEKKEKGAPKYSKKREFKYEERYHEIITDNSFFTQTKQEDMVNVDYGYGVPFIAWTKRYNAKDFDGNDFDVIKDKIINNKNNAKAYIHNDEDVDEPNKYPLLIDINNGEFGFLLPRSGDKKKYDFIQYDNIKYPTKEVAIEEKNDASAVDMLLQGPPVSVDSTTKITPIQESETTEQISPDDYLTLFNQRNNINDAKNEQNEHKEKTIYEELTACCDSLQQLKKIWTEKKNILTAGGSHFLCIVIKNADINGIKYIMENGGVTYLNTKSHLNHYPFDEIYDWKNVSLLINLKKDTITKDKMKYLIKMGSSMCWDAFISLYTWEKETYNLYIEMVQNPDFDNLRDDPAIANMLFMLATTVEEIQGIMAKGAKPRPNHIMSAFIDNDNERVAFLTKCIDINQTTDDKGNTILIDLCQETELLEFLDSKEGLQFVVFCLKNGADPNIKNASGESALNLIQMLCDKKETEMLKRILQEMKLSIDNDNYAIGCDDEIVDKKQVKEFIESKLFYGCDGPNKEADKPGYIDILMAFMMNDTEQLAFVLKKMDINETMDDKGNTTLHCFCKDHRSAEFLDSKDGLRMVVFCLKNGADPRIKNAAGESALSLVESFVHKKENSEMLKRVLYEMKSSIDDDYAPDYKDEIFIQRWKCVHCNYRNNLITNIVCNRCEVERIVDLTLFDELISIKEIGGVLYALIDCIALNSLIELDLLTLNQYDALFSKEIRKSRYLKEMQDRLTKTLSDEARNVLDVKKVKVVCLSKEVNLNIDDILKEVMSDSDLGNIIGEWKNEIGNSQKTKLQICKEKLLNKNSSNDFAEIYPLNKSFSLQDEQCMKFIAMCIAFKHSKFYLDYNFRMLFENTKWNYSDILIGYCKLLIKQDLLNEYKKNQCCAPMNMVNMKHKFEHFYFNEKISERNSLSVHAKRVQNILNYCNEYKHKMNAQNPNECLSEMRFGELLFNMDTEYNEQYEIDGNMLKDISQKILLERFVGDIINEWYCLDLKKMRSDGDRYEDATFSNYFYGVLSQKVETDTVYEIEFVESVVSYYHTYRS